MTLSYQAAGVDQDKADTILSEFGQYLKTRPKDKNLLSGIGPYASCYALGSVLRGMDDPLLVTCCDGVGTKVKLALEWNWVDGLGEDLVAMNVNDLLCVGAKPLVFLDYYACAALTREQLLPLLKSVQKGCEMAGAALAGGETAEMPGMYHGKDFDLAGFSVGVVDRAKAFSPEKVQVGHRLIAIASTGFHSNGYSLVRKLVESEKLDPEAKTPFSTATWREALLAPTKIYVADLLPYLSKLSGLAHLTGGGLMGNLPRVIPDGLNARVEARHWPFTGVFEWAQKAAKLSTQAMLETFNCGVGMVAILPVENRSTLLEHLEACGLRAWDIGQVVAGTAGKEAVVEWV